MLAGAFAERLSQRGHVDREVALLNRLIRPDTLHQLVFVEHVAAVLDKRKEDVERLWRERDLLLMLEQQPSHAVQRERTELVLMRALRQSRSRHFWKF
jgi:hypothetical protein